MPDQSIEGLIRQLHDHSMIKFGEFTLRSGKSSPIYVDLRDLPWFPGVLNLAAKFLVDKLRDKRLDGPLAGLPMTGVPIATAMGIFGDISSGYPRPFVKEHGTKKAIEGRFIPGSQIIAVDDLITDGQTKIDMITPFRVANLTVENVLVILDREQGGTEKLAEHGLTLHSLFTLRHALFVLRSDDRISAAQFTNIQNYLNT